MSSRVALLAVVALLASGTSASANAQSNGARRPDSLVTRFDWPIGMRAQVAFERIRSREIPGRPADSSRFEAHYRLRVLPHDSGRLVSADSFVVRRAPGLARGAGGQLPADLTESLQPSYIVRDDGEFVGVANIARMKAFMDTIVAGGAGGAMGAKLTAEQRAGLANVTSEQSLSAIAQQFWNGAVSTWTGESWVIGKEYASSAETPVPMVPGFRILLHYTIAAEARVACRAGEAERRCVRLRLASRPDSASLRAFFVAFSRMMKLDDGEVSLASMMRDSRMETEVLVVAEPSSLRPYDVRITRRMRIQVPATSLDSGGRVATFDSQRYRYTY